MQAYVYERRLACLYMYFFHILRDMLSRVYHRSKQRVFSFVRYAVFPRGGGSGTAPILLSWARTAQPVTISYPDLTSPRCQSQRLKLCRISYWHSLDRPHLLG